MHSLGNSLGLRQKCLAQKKKKSEAIQLVEELGQLIHQV